MVLYKLQVDETIPAKKKKLMKQGTDLYQFLAWTYPLSGLDLSPSLPE
jgi:hypothetical protein